MGKRTINISIDEELFMKTRDVSNLSALLNELLTNYFKIKSKEEIDEDEYLKNLQKTRKEAEDILKNM